MAAPVLTLALIAPMPGMPTGSANLTALTGGKKGFTRADYDVSGIDSLMRQKLNGGQQLQERTFGIGLTNGNYYWGGFTASYTDEISGTGVGSIYQSRSYNIVADINCGVVYTPIADQKLCSLYWYGLVSGGGYQAIATLSDGSIAPVTLTLPEGNASFKCVFRARVSGSTLDIRVKKIGTTGGFIAPQLRYLEVPQAPSRPTGLSRSRGG